MGDETGTWLWEWALWLWEWVCWFFTSDPILSLAILFALLFCHRISYC